MGVQTSEVGYTSAMPRREDHDVHKDMWGIGGKKKKDLMSENLSDSGVIIQCVPLATEPGISLIILTPMSGRKWCPLPACVMMSRFLYSEVIPLQIKIIKEMPGSVASGTHYISCDLKMAQCKGRNMSSA